MGHWDYGLEAVRSGLVQKIGHKGTILDAWAHVGQWGVRCAKAGADEVVLLEDSLGYAKMCEGNVVRNNAEVNSIVLHRGDVLDELRNMALSGIRFQCVSLNLRVQFERYFKQRRGQFGRWFKPSLKGYVTAISLGAQITGRGGYLLVTFLLPIVSEHWGQSSVQEGMERASRGGSMIFHATSLAEDCGLASSAMDDAWSHVVICVRLH